MLGYVGGFVGPLIVGFVLDWQGGMSVSHGHGIPLIAVLMLLALALPAPATRRARRRSELIEKVTTPPRECSPGPHR